MLYIEFSKVCFSMYTSLAVPACGSYRYLAIAILWILSYGTEVIGTNFTSQNCMHL